MSRRSTPLASARSCCTEASATSTKRGSSSPNASLCDEEESIYNLIPKPQEESKKPPRYVSKYDPTIPPTGSTFMPSAVGFGNLSGSFSKPAHHTTGVLGPKDFHPADSKQFLKKREKEPQLPDPTKFSYGERRKAPIVKKDEKPVIIRREKDFIKENALQTIMSAPKSRDNGPLSYREKAEYGQVPEYLNKIKSEIETEKQMIRSAIDQEREQSQHKQLKLLAENDRLELLASLRQKWDDVNRQYQSMTHMVTLDTITKVKKKEEYESTLQQLEKAMDKLSKKFVFVHDDQ